MLLNTHISHQQQTGSMVFLKDFASSSNFPGYKHK